MPSWGAAVDMLIGARRNAQRRGKQPDDIESFDAVRTDAEPYESTVQVRLSTRRLQNKRFERLCHRRQPHVGPVDRVQWRMTGKPSLDKKGELIHAHPDFQLVISYNPGYQTLMKDLKHSTKQRFTGFDFAYPDAALETEIVAKETGADAAMAAMLVKIGAVVRGLKGHGLDEGISTRLLVYAATLIKDGIDPRDACRMALVRPITDDADIRDTLDHAIDATFA